MHLSLDDLLASHPLLPLAWGAAAASADFLALERPDDLVVHSKSTPVDAVTEMDRGSEERIIARILAERPDDGILGEEGGERAGTSGVRWVIDPLDGTVNYLYRHEAWAVSIAAEVEGVSEIGVIAAPMLGCTFVAVRGGGAWLVRGADAISLQVGQCASLSMALVATGFGYSPQRRTAQAAVVHGLISQVRDIRRGGCATVDLGWLAMGRLDAFYELGLNRWDLAAGSLLVSEAGARIGSLDGDDIHAGTFVASIPNLYDELTTVLRSVS